MIKKNNAIKILLLLGCLFSCALFSCSSEDKFYSISSKVEPELEQLLSPKFFAGKEVGKIYSLPEVLDENDPLYKVLDSCGLINGSSTFFYAKKDCIALSTRISKSVPGTFTDVVIENNNNIGEFGYAATHLYTLNQDDETNRLQLRCYNLNGTLSLIIVKN